MSFDFEAAAKLPDSIRFGTSTWTYPGWRGIVYHREYKSEKEFTAKSLSEYAELPLFRTVGIDSTFYSPPTAKTLLGYAAQVPPSFQWVSKVWERMTVPRYPKHPRYGKLAGDENPNFLNAELFRAQVLPSYLLPETAPHTGPFVFQLPTIARSVMSFESFLSKMESCLRALPSDQRYAVEIRNPEYLVPEYFQVLNRFGATHCFNHWDRMPALRVQMKAAADAGGLDSDFYVARILTPKGVSYEKAVELFSPYDTLKQPNEEMREDVVRLVRRSLQTRKTAFVIVNNRSEGNAPMTIDAITRMAALELPEESERI